MSVWFLSPAHRRRARRWTAAVLSAAAAGTALFFTLRQGKATPSTTLPTATARKGEFPVIVTCRGELVAGRSIMITAPVNVPNLQIVWLLPPGTAVKTGDAIVRFDPSTAERQLKEQKATLAQAQATLDQAVAENRITIEQDRLQLASLVQAAERARLEASKAQIVSAIQAEENRIDLGVAEEKVRVQQAAIDLNIASGQSKIASLTSQRDKADTQVRINEERLAKMEVRAPADGVVNYLMNYSQGWMNAKPFKAGDSVWPGSAIAEIPDLTTLRLKGKAEEIDRGRMKPGQDARVILDPFPEKTFNGRLESISPLTEQSFEWPPSRSFRAFAGLGETDPRLRPAMNGRLDVIVERLRDAVSVPAKAVFAHDGRPVVLVPGKDGVRPVKVEVLARNPDEVAIRGIEAGTLVAVVDPTAAEREKQGKSKSFEIKAR